MNRFKTFVEQTPFSRIRQIYDETFSLEGVYPYVGYYLLGDGSHRRLFLDGLREQYRIYDFSAGQELADHLGIMLQFLAESENEDERDELIFLCILPSLKGMVEGIKGDATPYKNVLQALLLVLRGEQWKEDDQNLVDVEVQEFPRNS